jgi:hypothetical protein
MTTRPAHVANYTPDPFALQISALIMARRAQCLDLPRPIVDKLMTYAGRVMQVAEYLEKIAGQPTPFDPSAAEIPTDPTVAFESGAWVCLTQRVIRPSIGLEIRHYRLVDRASADQSRLAGRSTLARAAAVLDLIQHTDGRWEVYHIDVGQRHSRQGLATLLYNKFQATESVELRPSGWLSDEARSFWAARNPDAVRFHVREDTFPGLWISPKQLLNLMSVCETLLMMDDQDGKPN